MSNEVALQSRVPSCEDLGIPYRAVWDHILVLRPAPLEKTASGLVIPDNAKKPYHYGFVFAVGPEVKNVAPGDFVIFEPSNARDVFFDDPNKTMFTVVSEPGVYLAMAKAKALEARLLMPQTDVIDVLSRTVQTAVALTA